MSIQANFPAIKPTLLLDFANTEALDPRITYSRASTGTYYDGKTVAKAEENLFQYSQEFNNSYWFLFELTTTANSAVAPDGTTTADSIVESTTTSMHLVYRDLALSALPYTLSAYMKANTRNFGALRIFDGVTRVAVFDLSTGVVSSTIGGVTATISSVGNGWYRCTMLIPVANAVVSSIGICTSETGTFVNYLGNGSGIFVWGAQLEQRSFATAYTPTTTAPITNYIPVLQTASAGTPRFDHNPITGESLGLLIEEQRTNLATYSADLSNAAWTKTNTTITADTIVAPDGTLTGDKILENATTATHTIYDSFSVTSGTAYTYSGYFKAGERSIFQIACYAVGLVYTAEFDLNALTVTNRTGTGSATITAVGNGWYRCTATMTATSTASGAGIQINLCSAASTSNYAGNTSFGIYAWGFQAEAGAFATSYMPTVASQVTRAADSASMTGTNFSSWYNQSEGSFYAEATAAALSSTAGNPGTFVGISDGTVSNRLRLKSENGTAWEGAVAGTSQFAIGTYGSAGVSYKLAGAYKVNDFAYSFNGTTAATDTLGTVPVVSQMQIGNLTTAREFNGTIKKIVYYPVRVTNAQLQALTS